MVWSQVLALLDIPYQADVLPTFVPCPICSAGRLMILQDNLSGGQWHWCEACRTAGDMIELVAKTWGFGIPATIAKLAATGVDITASREEIRDYTREHPNYRKHLLRFWKACRSGKYHRSATIQRLVNQLHLRNPSTPERWETGPGLLIGAATHDEAEDVFCPGRDYSRKLFRPAKAPLWSDVMVLPFFDMPGHVCAFLFIGRNGQEASDFVFKRGYFRAPGHGYFREGIKEAGLAMHPDIFRTSGEWDNQIIAINNPLLAIQLHARHLDYSLRQLPLVAWYPNEESRTRYAWRMFAGKRVIIWAPAMTTDVIQQIVETRAFVSTVGPQEDHDDGLQQYVWRQTAEDLVTRIISTAQPGHIAVASYLDTQSNRRIEEILWELRLNKLDISLIIERAPGNIRKRLRSITEQHHTLGVSISLTRHNVIEIDYRLYAAPKNKGEQELIMDAILRLDYVINQPRIRQAYYQGRLIYQGKEVPFCLPQSDLATKPMEALDRLLMDAGVGSLTFNKTWNNRLIAVAKQFQQPKFITGVDTVGWDSSRAAFVFPQYRIELGGHIQENTGIFPPGSPGASLAKPEVLSGQELAGLRLEEPSSDMLWASVVAILANVIAPAFNRKTCGIALVGPGMTKVGHAVAKAVGCVVRQLWQCQGHRQETENLLDAEAMHNWPLAVLSGARPAKLRQFIDPVDGRDQWHNCMVATDWYMATTKKLLGGWHVLENQEAGSLPEAAQHSLRQLIPAYLQDLCQRRLVWSTEEPDWYEQILGDLAEFVTRHHGDGQAVYLARGVATADREHGHADAFAELTSQYVRDGNFVLLPEGYEDENPAVLRVESGYTKAAIRVPKAHFADALAKRTIRFADFARVSTVLSRAGKLLDDSEEYWTVPENWWMRHMKQSQKIQAGLLRVWS